MFYILHNASRYDNLLYLRGLLDYACRENITYQSHDGGSYTRPLLVSAPKAIFRSENEPISLNWQFACPFELCSCSMSHQDRKEMTMRGERYHPCPFDRRIKVIDSFLFINSSLDNLIKGVHEASEKEGLDLDGSFPVTMKFLREKNYSPRQISLVIKSKLKMPYESVTCYQDLLKTECPEPEAFVSLLRGTGNLGEEDMTTFKKIWQELKIPNLLSLYQLYVQLDTVTACDAIHFYFEKLFKVCKIHPLWHLTISGLAISSMLLNLKDAHEPNKSLFIPFLTGQVHDEFEKKLTGLKINKEKR